MQNQHRSLSIEISSIGMCALSLSNPMLKISVPPMEACSCWGWWSLHWSIWTQGLWGVTFNFGQLLVAMEAILNDDDDIKMWLNFFHCTSLFPISPLFLLNSNFFLSDALLWFKIKQISSLKCFQFSLHCKSLSKVTQTNDKELSSKNISEQNRV